ncbi:unnamed protein product, partial [Rotaria sp. Silwood1]
PRFISHLERVLIDKCGIYCNNIGSFFKHFLDSNRYHYLQTYKDFDSKTDNVTSVLLIEHLTILNFNDQYSEPIFIFPIPHYHALTHLNLNWYRPACMKTIDYLFKYVPRIHHFKLQANVAYQREHVEPIFWETSLRKNLVELKWLSLLAYIYDDSSSTDPIWNYLINTEPIIEQIEKSNYWSSHQWKATFHSSIPTLSDDVYWAEFEVF